MNVKFLKRYVASGMSHPVQRDIPQTSLAPGQFETEAIVGHHGAARSLAFEVKWYGFDETTVEPLCCFTNSKGQIINEHLKEYVATHGVQLPSD